MARGKLAAGTSASETIRLEPRAEDEARGAQENERREAEHVQDAVLRVEHH